MLGTDGEFGPRLTKSELEAFDELETAEEFEPDRLLKGANPADDGRPELGRVDELTGDEPAKTSKEVARTARTPQMGLHLVVDPRGRCHRLECGIAIG